MKYTNDLGEVYLGKQLVAYFDTLPEAQYVTNVLNQELGKYEQIVKNRNETITNLQDDLVNANVEIKMLQEQLAKLSIVEDIAENLLDPSDTRLADAEQTIATQTAVIEAQSERVKELERELAKYEPKFKAGDKVQNYGRIVEIKEIVDMSVISFHYTSVEIGGEDWELIPQSYLQPLAESEADNG